MEFSKIPPFVAVKYNVHGDKAIKPGNGGDGGAGGYGGASGTCLIVGLNQTPNFNVLNRKGNFLMNYHQQNENLN